MKFSLKDFFSKCGETADLATFTKKIRNGKLHFLRGVEQLLWNVQKNGCSEIYEDMRGGNHPYPDIQLPAWNVIEDRLEHMYFSANFSKLLATPTRPVWELWSAIPYQYK